MSSEGKGMGIQCLKVNAVADDLPMQVVQGI